MIYQHFYGMGSQPDCTDRSCLKIAELKNFARYDLCSVTCSYPHLLARSYALLGVLLTKEAKVRKTKFAPVSSLIAGRSEANSRVTVASNLT